MGSSVEVETGASVVVESLEVLEGSEVVEGSRVVIDAPGVVIPRVSLAEAVDDSIYEVEIIEVGSVEEVLNVVCSTSDVEVFAETVGVETDVESKVIELVSLT